MHTKMDNIQDKDFQIAGYTKLCFSGGGRIVFNALFDNNFNIGAVFNRVFRLPA